MAGGSASSSPSIRHRGRGKPPLILCPDCKSRWVVELKSKKPWSKGQIFYTCPNHQSDGSGCPFWHWEQSYANYLEENAEKLTFKAFDGTMVNAEFVANTDRNGQKLEEGNIDMSVLIGLGRSLLVVGKEIAWLLRCVLVVCVVVVFVLGMLLLVQIKK